MHKLDYYKIYTLSIKNKWDFSRRSTHSHQGLQILNESGIDLKVHCVIHNLTLPFFSNIGFVVVVVFTSVEPFK